MAVNVNVQLMLAAQRLTVHLWTAADANDRTPADSLSASPPRSEEGCRAVRELRLGRPSCDHHRKKTAARPTLFSLPTKISKTTPCKVAWWSLAWML